jgi:hypothetical protein
MAADAGGKKEVTMSNTEQKIILLLALVISLFPVSANAGQTVRDREAVMESFFDEHCARYGVPKYLALAVARQESGMHPWIINVSGRDIRPSNGLEALSVATAALKAGRSFDVGIMQVNVYWLKEYNIPLSLALYPRTNIQLGVWILAQEIRKHGLTWKAVANYHTPLHRNPERGRNYAASVLSHLRRIMAERG